MKKERQAIKDLNDTGTPKGKSSDTSCKSPDGKGDDDDKSIDSDDSS